MTFSCSGAVHRSEATVLNMKKVERSLRVGDESLPQVELGVEPLLLHIVTSSGSSWKLEQTKVMAALNPVFGLVLLGCCSNTVGFFSCRKAELGFCFCSVLLTLSSALLTVSLRF